jgi:hypothetical protein
MMYGSWNGGEKGEVAGKIIWGITHKSNQTAKKPSNNYTKSKTRKIKRIKMNN